jgi:hypothetical protein
MFTSRRPEELATFLRVTTDEGPATTVTHGHYMLAAPPGSYLGFSSMSSLSHVPARDLLLGMQVPIAVQRDGVAGFDVKMANVTSIAEVSDLGVYMPHTLSGAIVVDGVVVSELTDFVPGWLAGRRLHRAMVAGLRGAFAVLPKWVDDAAAKWLSSVFHGNQDAVVSRAAFLAGTSS